ncbi:stAR-related lipid transfer protein 8 isoform X1 [Pelodiscus sinensis]|uniref:stAR-related lipid transfer protein 8 isoform X1 n=1 Tax=Pelodiscus sinensis TaxID=13735 RepID=UPI003F6D6BE2
MDPKDAKHRMMLPFIPGQHDKVIGNEDEEGLYGFFCMRGNTSNPEEEPDYALIADECPLTSEELFPEWTIKVKPGRVLEICPSVIIFTEDCGWSRGSIVGSELPSNANIFIFNSPAQLKCGPLGERERRDDTARQDELHRPELKRDQWLLHSESNRAGKCMWSHNCPNPDEVERLPCCMCFTLLEDKRDAVEAKKACDWLRAAGFPQYAHLYEDSRFPIDITSVKKDHSFLDQDSLKSLCRRLMTLNTCASMKLEVHFQHKQNEDSEEEDLCAISDRWAFQRDSKRWSRIGSVDFLSRSPEMLNSTMRQTSSHESILTDLSANLEATSLHSNTSTGGTIGTVVTPPDVSPSRDSPNITKSSQSLNDHCLADQSPTQSGSAKEKSKRWRSRSFLKRIESLRRKDKEKSDSKAKDAISGRTVTKPGLHSAKANGHLTAATTISPKRGMSSSFHGNKHFLSMGYKTNRTSDSGERKPGSELRRSGVYLEDYETALKNSTSWAAGELGYGHVYKGNCLIHLPGDHKPGTFPKSLSIESLCPLDGSPLAHWKPGNKTVGLSGCNLGGSSSSLEDSSPQGFVCRQRRGSCSSVGSQTSMYDNMPEFGSSEDLFSMDGEVIYKNLDDILQDVWGLQRKVELWSKALSPDLDGEGDGEEEQETDSGGEPTFPSNLNFEEQSMSDVGTSASDFDSTGNSLNEGEEIEVRERRDSGVGASLTRPCRKLRWHSFQNSHRPSLNSASLEINRQSSAQLNLLQKCSLLRLTAIMEKHSVPNKQAWAWTVPKFMKRSKAPDYRDKMVFGVPPIINVQRTGQPLPQSIQQAMRYIRSQCLDQVGIFRKSGVKSRIQALRHMNEASPENVNYEGQSAYDVADLLKQYFRDLPEPIFTSKLTDTFLQIYQFVPKEQRLQAVQAAVVLMPDENREVLQTLLYFLSDIASAEENQMTSGNLAVCLAPSIFHLNVSKKESTSPRMIQKRGTMGKPDQKDLNENMAATQGLSHMVTDCKKVFQIPHDMMLQLCNSYVAADAHPLSLAELTSHSLQDEGKDFQASLEDSVQNLLKESSERFKGWLSTPGPLNTELSCKKVGDGHPLRLWKVSTEMEAPPSMVLQRVLRERHLWDEDLLQGKVIEALDKNMEVYHYVTDSMAPHPRRDFVVLRKWRTDLPRGACLLVSMSLEHEKLQVEGGVRAVVLTSQYLIEPCGMGRSKVTHICRTDLRGRSPEWYSKVFGQLCAMELARIRDSFPVLNPCGSETKI